MAELLPLHPRRDTDLEPLWRHLLGDRLRRLRRERHETLADVARRAGVSVQYLSEVERGRKEPSSEMIAAITGALEVTLLDLTASLADELRGGTVLSSTRIERSTTPPSASTQCVALAA